MKTRNLLFALCALFLSSLYSFSFAQTTDKLMVAGSSVWGGWSTDNSAVMLQDANDPTVFVYTGWINANEDFKFLTQAGWGGQEYRNAGDLTGDGILTGTLVLRQGDDGDTKFQLPESANYKITANLTNLTISAEKITYQDKPILHNVLYLVGDATPGGWDLGQSLSLNQSSTNPFLFSNTVALTVRTFKIPVNKYAGFGQKFYFRDATDNAKISEDGTDDRQWSITENGTYVVTVDLENATISIVEDTGTGLNNPESSAKIRSLDNKSFEIRGVENATLHVFSMQGALLQTVASAKNEQLLDLSNVSAGLYLIKITDGRSTTSHKVIVK